MNSVILRSAVRVMTPIILALSVILVLRGHDAPGGGFIGALVAGVALVLRRLAAPDDVAKPQMPVRPEALAATGLSVAVMTGIGGLVLGGDFLGGAVWRIDLPPFPSVKVVTSLLFDVGVYLLVVGLVATALRELGGEP